MSKFNFYAVFYLNLMYSSISLKDRITVIKKCYWPLLDLIEKGFPIGVQVSGLTLEIIEESDPLWVKKLKKHLSDKKCELIGSGYSQIIAPLVPAKVNHYNQIFGLEVYKSILSARPKVASVNEMAYSSGTIEHFLNSNYRAIIMEWNNSYRFHPEWNKEWQYHPQTVFNQKGKDLLLIWNNSIAFQKFQRYAQGEIEISEYLSYLKSQLGKNTRFFPLYGSDTEIFDFRPGRYDTEAKINKEGEWNRIQKLLKILMEDSDFEIILPSRVLELEKTKNKMAFNRIRLESPEQPIVVKKQEKYNITRWALTGRDDLVNNTKCYQIYNALKNFKKEQISLWKELCFLWSSDFRTHIEEKKYLKFQKGLNRLLSLTKKLPHKEFQIELKEIKQKKSSILQPTVVKNDKIIVETKSLKIVLNPKRGLTISSLIFKNISKKSLIGTLPHGYYDDISFGADFYTGHTIIEIPGKKKVTDLDVVRPMFSRQTLNSDVISVKTTLNLSNLGRIFKEILIYNQKNQIDLNYKFDFPLLPPCSFHSGIVTLNPEAFNVDSLYYGCNNGGKEMEKFFLKNKTLKSEPLSFLISSKNVLGNTEGNLEIGDKTKSVVLKTDMSKLAILPMINFVKVSPNYFLRTLFSLREIDDTSLSNQQKKKFGFTVSITAEA